MPDHQFHTPRPVRIEVKVAAGDIRIASVEGEKSTVVLEGSPELVEATRVELVGDRLIIEQRRKSLLDFFTRWEDALHVRASVPHASSVEIVTAAGEANLEGSFAGLEMKSASGSIVVTGEVGGDASVKTVSGGVRLPRVIGHLIVQTVSGHTEARSVEGSVSVKSVSGDLRVDWLREGRVNVQSVSGDIELGIAPGSAVDVDARSASGDLHSEVPLSETPVDGGEPTVVIRGNTVSGDFRVRRATELSAASA